MDPMESSCNAIIKQELIIDDDLELHDYEHLLQEFYYDQPADENQSDTVGDASEFQVEVEVPVPEEAEAVPWPVEEPSGRDHGRLTAIPMHRDEHGLFNCAECGKSYEKENTYFWHVRRHLNKKNERFFCQPCARSYTTKYHLLQHYTNIHGMAFDASSQMVVQVESNQVPSALESNQQKDDQLEGDSFDFLLETFDEEVANPSSVIVKEEYVFEDGNQADDYETSLVDVLHSSTEIRPAMASKKSSRTTGPARVRPYYAQQCPVCKNWYHTAAGLQRHLQRHHGMQENEILPTVDIDTALSCAICDKHFASPQQYKLHKKRHAKIDSGNFKCTYCSKILGSNQKLKSHEMRKHRTIPSKSVLKSEMNPIDQPKPCTIILEDIHRQQDVKESPKKTQRKQKSPAFRHWKGRPKGSRQCPVCKQWFLTQDDLRVHFPVHNQRSKHVETKMEYNQDRPNPVEIMPADHQLDPELSKPLEMKSEPILNVRRKAGRPKGSRNSSSLPKVKSEPSLHERGNGIRQLRKRVSNPPDLKSEPTLHERPKPIEIKPEPFQLVRRKAGRPKGSRNGSRLIVIKEEPQLHVRRKVGRPKKVENVAKVNGLKQEERLGQLRRKVGRPNKKSFTYCARCSKHFTSYASFKAHKSRHRNVDQRRFWCIPCEKGFASMNEKVSHEQRGHKHKVGSPGTVQPLKPLTRKPANEHKASFGGEERKRKVGRPKVCRKCPLCKIWIRSTVLFKEHVREHIQG
ncbi:zinc finger protein 709 [Culex quinquefasciatus]|uniref:zinc finger protein 709 n=1 Tax=Culex quinquefasciatus TaxID=7176 RepID=UPI0018E2AF61|nr:zinc finger protein 709 [Culex quinquefasciatus]XP_038110326.1 zinc finger protein 709 [Culex quinquefasciatus]